MPRLNVAHLKARLKNRKPKRAGSKSSDFMALDARVEDTKRIAAIRASRPHLPKDVRKEGRRLAKRLTYERDPPHTLASAAFYFQKREAIVDNLVKLTWRLSEDEVFTAALIPVNATRASLTDFDPHKFLRLLRADLDRAGGRKAKGWIFVGGHGERDEAKGLWNPHYHLVICGAAMRAVVEKLRRCGKYKVGDIDDRASADAGTPPIQIKTIKRDELRYSLSYAAQIWWPGRWRGRNTEGDRIASARGRIRGVQHTEFLLWLDRQQLHRMYLLYGLEVGRDGLRPTRPGKTRAPIKRGRARNGD